MTRGARLTAAVLVVVGAGLLLTAAVSPVVAQTVNCASGGQGGDGGAGGAGFGPSCTQNVNRPRAPGAPAPVLNCPVGAPGGTGGAAGTNTPGGAGGPGGQGGPVSCVQNVNGTVTAITVPAPATSTVTPPPPPSPPSTSPFTREPIDVPTTALGIPPFPSDEALDAVNARYRSAGHDGTAGVVGAAIVVVLLAAAGALAWHARRAVNPGGG